MCIRTQAGRNWSPPPSWNPLCSACVLRCTRRRSPESTSWGSALRFHHLALCALAGDVLLLPWCTCVSCSAVFVLWSCVTDRQKKIAVWKMQGDRLTVGGWVVAVGDHQSARDDDCMGSCDWEATVQRHLCVDDANMNASLTQNPLCLSVCLSTCLSGVSVRTSGHVHLLLCWQIDHAHMLRGCQSVCLLVWLTEASQQESRLCGYP